MDFSILQGLNVFGRSAKMSNAQLVDQLPERDRRRFERTAVPKHQRRTDTQTSNEPVPHHPASCRVVEKDIIRCETIMDDMFFLELKQQASARVHDALGQASGTRAKHDKPRVVERELFEDDVLGHLVLG